MASRIPVWLITGSSRGLGRATLDAVLASGQRAVATLRSPEVLAHYKAKYPPSQLLVTRLDVLDNARIVDVFKEVKEHFGRLDVVVNNAGYGIEGELETTPEEEARKLFNVCFWAVVNISKQAVAFMRDVNPPGQGGRILNISSVAGVNANPVIGFYSAAKYAVEGFTESLSKEMLPEWNIKPIIIQPGLFQTEWTKSLVTIPVAPQYAVPGTPSSIFRYVMQATWFGDPAKGAQALLRIAKEPNPPLRLQLGTDCIFVTREKVKRILKDSEKWEELGHSTNVDGLDKGKLVEQLRV